MKTQDFQPNSEFTRMQWERQNEADQHWWDMCKKYGTPDYTQWRDHIEYEDGSKSDFHHEPLPRGNNYQRVFFGRIFQHYASGVIPYLEGTFQKDEVDLGYIEALLLEAEELGLGEEGTVYLMSGEGANALYKDLDANRINSVTGYGSSEKFIGGPITKGRIKLARSWVDKSRKEANPIKVQPIDSQLVRDTYLHCPGVFRPFVGLDEPDGLRLWAMHLANIWAAPRQHSAPSDYDAAYYNQTGDTRAEFLAALRRVQAASWLALQAPKAEQKLFEGRGLIRDGESEEPRSEALMTLATRGAAWLLSWLGWREQHPTRQLLTALNTIELANSSLQLTSKEIERPPCLIVPDCSPALEAPRFTKLLAEFRQHLPSKRGKLRVLLAELEPLQSLPLGMLQTGPASELPARFPMLMWPQLEKYSADCALAETFWTDLEQAIHTRAEWAALAYDIVATALGIEEPLINKELQGILLQDVDGQVREFAPDHAERLLAYSGSLWVKAPDGATPTPPPPAEPKKEQSNCYCRTHPNAKILAELPADCHIHRTIRKHLPQIQEQIAARKLADTSTGFRTYCETELARHVKNVGDLTKNLAHPSLYSEQERPQMLELKFWNLTLCGLYKNELEPSTLQTSLQRSSPADNEKTAGISYFHSTPEVIARQNKLRSEAHDAARRQAMLNQIRKRLNGEDRLRFLQEKSQNDTNVYVFRDWLETQLFYLKQKLSDEENRQLETDIKEDSASIALILPYSDTYSSHFIKRLKVESLLNVPDFLQFTREPWYPGLAGFYLLNKPEDVAYFRDLITQHLDRQPEDATPVMRRATEWLTAEIERMANPEANAFRLSIQPVPIAANAGQPTDNQSESEHTASTTTLFDKLCGGFKPESLVILLGPEGLGLYDFDKKRQTDTATSTNWAELYWALRYKGFLPDGLSAGKAEELLKTTFGVKTSKTRITDTKPDFGRNPKTGSYFARIVDLLEKI